MSWRCNACGNKNSDQFLWCDWCDECQRTCDGCGSAYWEWIRDDEGNLTFEAACQVCGDIVP